MKKIFIILFLLISLVTNAQDITKFMGIPVDGTKSEMIQKLKNKGYIYNNHYDCLEGEFNGENVQIFIQTTNNKVWRLAVMEKTFRNEADIRNHFNTLVKQFRKNDNYISPYEEEEQIIPESEDISYGILVKNKLYDAYFNQKLEYDFDLEDENSIHSALENLDNKLVWFRIFQSYSDYSVGIFYENGYNKANGKDL